MGHTEDIESYSYLIGHRLASQPHNDAQFTSYINHCILEDLSKLTYLIQCFLNTLFCSEVCQTRTTPPNNSLALNNLSGLLAKDFVY